MESIDIEETLANEEIIDCYYQTCQKVKFIEIKERNRPLDDLAKDNLRESGLLIPYFK